MKLEIYVVGLIIAIIIFGFFLPKGWNWASVIGFMTAFVALLGKLITGRYSGILINERNKMSLSRFQTVIWTLIVLSAFLTIALERIRAGEPDALAIGIPEQLWAILGISTTSLVGTSLILGTKVDKKPTPEARDKAVDLFIKQKKANATEARALIDSRSNLFGTLDFNEKITDANFSNLFTGDEIENSGIVDVAKVQKFFFTIIIAFSYMVLLINLIMSTEPSNLNNFPELSDGLVALLGISAAGYLTNKVNDHTKT